MGMMEVTGDAPDRWDKDYQSKISELNPITAPSSGTKWHKPGVPKNWYEAKTEDGNSYYWHVHTQESRWTEPQGGFVSVEEQTKLVETKHGKERRKKELIEESRSVHGEHITRDRELRALPDMSIKDPYGAGGWSSVEKKAVSTEKVDLGLPPKREKMQPVIYAEPEKAVWKERTVETGSLGNSFGLVPSEKTEEGTNASYTKPVINFRKRKNQSIRQREDDD